MTTLPNMGLVLPTRGAPGAGIWDDTVDANYQLEDAHDHSPGKGLRITPAAININADLPLNSSWGITAANRITFASVANPAVNKSVFVSDGTGGLTAGELYWISNTGTAVRLTNGSALNVAAFTGGIGGDYASVGAAVAFDDAGDRYTFKQQSPGNWARLACGDVRLFETGTTDSVFVGLAAPAALAASYTITMPLAAPGSTSLVQMDSSGVLTASNTVGNTLTMPATMAGATNFSGAITMGSTLSVTGILTGVAAIQANSGIDVGTNQHVAVHGTGRFKHGARELNLAISAYGVDGASTYTTFNQAGYISTFGGVCSCQAWIPLEVGKRIVSLQQFYDVAGTGSGIQFFLKRINHATGTVTTVSSSSSDSTGTGIESQTISSINHTVLTGEAYWVQVNVASATHRVYGCTITYDDP